MLKRIAVVVLALLAALLGFAATRPGTFHIERSARIHAPPDRVFALIEDFHGWGAWSPWEKLDPAMQRSYSGAASGEGAVYEWRGDPHVGRGRMQIVDVVPPSKVVIQLDFLEPFEAHNTAEFTLDGAGGATDVTWAMNGANNFVSKLLGIFVDMDQMIGKDFETGLANLKAAAEQPATPGAA